MLQNKRERSNTSLSHKKNKYVICEHNNNHHHKGNNMCYNDNDNDNEQPFCVFATKSIAGAVRNYNEDRIAYEVNMKYIKCNNNNNSNNKVKYVHYFAIFDGHGGSKCADFLKSNFLYTLQKNQSFPSKPAKALIETVLEIEKAFYTKHKPLNLLDTIELSGSCAIILLLINNICYCANIGDSRAIYVSKRNKQLYQLNIEHKPNEPTEKARIYNAGGSIYQNKYNTSCNTTSYIPWRVIPGKLSVSVVI